MENNNIIKLQKMLMKEMERLDDNDRMNEDAFAEVERSKAISNTAATFLKSVATNIRVIETSDKYKIGKEELEKKLGIVDD